MRVRVNQKHLGMKFKLLYLMLIISILMYMFLPVILPIKSSASSKYTGYSCAETKLGKIVFQSKCSDRLQIGDIIPIEISIEATDIIRIRRLNYI